MKKLAFILIMLTLVQFTWAQKKEWSSPFVGYSTTKNLTTAHARFRPQIRKRLSMQLANW